MTQDTVLGDPGLLISKILNKKQEKQYALGIVPHFLDKNDARICNFCKKYSKEILFIDIQHDPLTVLKEIDKCNYVLSSSLHGLVFADSLHIPNIWMILSDQVAGKGFKFYDYNSALKKRQNPINISGDEALSHLIAQNSAPSNSILEEVKHNLDQAYCLLKEEIFH
jgi:pyruvyltransferase